MPNPQRILLLCAAVLGMSNISIADLASTEQIETGHLLEAIQYRSLDRNLFY